MSVPLTGLALDALTTVPPAIALFGLAVAVVILPRRVGHAVAAAVAIGTCGWLLAVPAGTYVRTSLFGFEVVLFSVDVYSRLLAVAFGFIAAAGTGYLFATGGDRRQTAYALAYVGSGMGAAVAGDWLTLVVFWELMAVWATVLVWHRSSDWSVGTRYAIYHEIGGLALMAGVLLHYAEVGTFLYGDGITAGLPATFAALGIGINAGFVGLHVWLVDTYPRTHVATSVVLAAITTKVGAYSIVRAFPDGHVVLAYVGGAMVLFGVTLAILQTDMRRLLSYHIVSQVGYMVAGFGIGAALADAGALAHLVNNILYKSLLFMVAGVVIHRTGEESLKKIGGLGRAMPLTAGVFLVAALSIAGVPGFNGFVSKGMVLDGVEKAGFDVLWYALLFGGVGTVVSFSKFGYYAFLRGESETEYTDLRSIELGVLGSVAALCVLFGMVPTLLFGLLPAEGVVSAKPFAGKQFLKAGGVTAAGVVAFFVIRTRLSHVTPVADLDIVYHPVGRRLVAVSVAGAGAVEDGINRVGERIRESLRSILVAPTGRDGSALSTSTSQSIGVGVLAVVLVLVLLLAVFVI
ncbi:proton-conducting transporter transmembrane domain-containing protein [Halorussus salinisoli]|uniref:proton-conducting transporter transmembrane domain-containing protein n=1 Tax=Halorussus salinisoli TaxID=2558242 RepID=UPI0010C2101D|nr:proton-conducting transporter membrane subunit [Halorussus salinisoli]